MRVSWQIHDVNTFVSPSKWAAVSSLPNKCQPNKTSLTTHERNYRTYSEKGGEVPKARCLSTSLRRFIRIFPIRLFGQVNRPLSLPSTRQKATEPRIDRVKSIILGRSRLDSVHESSRNWKEMSRAVVVGVTKRSLANHRLTPPLTSTLWGGGNSWYLSWSHFGREFEENENIIATNPRLNLFFSLYFFFFSFLFSFFCICFFDPTLLQLFHYGRIYNEHKETDKYYFSLSIEDLCRSQKIIRKRGRGSLVNFQGLVTGV